MTLVLLYLGVGALNVVGAGVQHKLMIGSGRWLEGAVEIAWYWLLWPIQFGFWMVVLLHGATERILEKVLR